MILEVCVDDAGGLAAAIEGGADRIELCAALALGGLTPPPGLMALAARAPIPVMAMIRPRAGGFVWSAQEGRQMRDDIAAARAAGLSGVVIGASLADGRLDADLLAELVAEARGMDLTLHRAIDLVPDRDAALGLCRALGIGRVLTSGGARTAAEGARALAAMAGQGVTIMPGGGIAADTAAALVRATGAREIHASCSVPATPDVRLMAFGFLPPGQRRTDVDKVRALRQALDQIGAGPPSG